MGWKDDKTYRKAFFGVKPEDFSNLPPADDKKTALGGDLYKDRGKGWEFMPVMIGGVPLWNPIIRAMSKKTIIITEMPERTGSVKEIISQNDWEIMVRGTIKNENGRWPDFELDELLKLYELNEPVAISSALTDRLLNGNEYVVIKSLNLPDKPGYTQSVDYTIEMISDIPFELELE